mmetsp:Transcript_23957/g.42228  ORF Transcript_23957/g.42228 Transcript_23957/m.42228 type:complete len:103 (-) Transcript_23957:706-1014(-)
MVSSGQTRRKEKGEYYMVPLKVYFGYPNMFLSCAFPSGRESFQGSKVLKNLVPAERTNGLKFHRLCATWLSPSLRQDFMQSWKYHQDDYRCHFHQAQHLAEV